MRNLIIRKKTGFKILDPFIPVNIRDFRGIMFYSTESRTPRVKVFNLPKGKYFVDSGKFTELGKAIKFQLPKLPKRQRHNKPFPSHFDFKYLPNPNKCTIFWNRKLIVCDPNLKNLTLPELYFILFHEFSHSRYGTEEFADLGSSYLMLKNGFNPSQIVKSNITSLSEGQIGRKYFIYNKMLNSRYES